MSQALQPSIEGRGYRFSEGEFACSELSDPVRYENITGVCLVPGSSCFEISFKTPKGKKRQVSVNLENPGQEKALQEMLLRKIPGAAADTRPQTVREAAGGWATLGLCLTALVALIIALNTWGRGTSVSVPIWFLPFLMIGSVLSTGTLVAIGVAILLVCGIGAVLSLKKRKTVWEIQRQE